MIEDHDEELDWPDSGPLCQHDTDTSECERLCTCGHKCREHDRYEDMMCDSEDDCPCERFKDAP